MRISLKAFFSFGNKVRRKIVSIFDDKLISNSVETFVCKVWHNPLLKFTMNRRNIFLECLLIIQMALDFLILVLHNYYFPGKFRCFFWKSFQISQNGTFLIQINQSMVYRTRLSLSNIYANVFFFPAQNQTCNSFAFNRIFVLPSDLWFFLIVLKSESLSYKLCKNCSTFNLTI